MFSPHSQKNKTYYEILEIDKNSTEDEIKKAYRRLSLLYHPDRNTSPEATEKIREINTAYETLGDKEARRRYDNQLSNKGNIFEFSSFGTPNGNNDNPNQMFFHTNFGSGGEHIDFANIDNIFETVFGIGRGGGINPEFFNNHIHQQLNKPLPIVVNTEITMTQSYNGCIIPIQINKLDIVNGKQIRNIETVYVTIPEGIDNNEVIIIREKGNETANGTKGDVKVFITIKKDDTNPHELLFERQGLNLIIKKEISLKEALCGFSFNIKHINGSSYCIKNTNIVLPGQKVAISNLGIKRDGNIGNLMIDYTIIFPSSLDNDKKELITNIL